MSDLNHLITDDCTAWCLCPQVGDLRRALVGWPEDAPLVDERGAPVAVLRMPPHGSDPAYLMIPADGTIPLCRELGEPDDLAMVEVPRV